MRRFRFKFFSVLSETVFARIVPASNENDNERRTLIAGNSDIGENFSLMSMTPVIKQLQQYQLSTSQSENILIRM